MEAATAASTLPARVRASAFERDCERLRPLGEAYLLRRFGGSLNRADAEDAVAEVLIRLYRMAAAGRPPQNLRATFFTSVRNQAIDQLRSRAIRPTVELEEAGEAASTEAPPSEWAESREDSARLGEALGRMRANYRQAILLRFGLGMTVPEIATYLEISLPAAKKLVLRSTAQARKRLEAIDGAEFCPQMRDLARRSVLDRHLSETASKEETELLRAHFAHCGACKSFLTSLHERMHELGSVAVFGIAGGDHLGVHVGVVDHLSQWGTTVLDGAHAGAGRVRHLAYKATGALPGSDGGAGVLLSSGQKIAAVCTAGAATTATCLLTGAVGPGINAAPATAEPPPRPAAQVRELQAPSEVTPTPEASPPEASPPPDPEPPAAQPASTPAPLAPSAPVQAPEATEASPAPEPAVSEPSEFGSASPPPSAARTPAAPTGEEFGAGAAAEPAPASSAGVGFHG